MGRRQTIDRDQLLDAAEAVIGREGAAGLTHRCGGEGNGHYQGRRAVLLRYQDALIDAIFERWGARPTTACSKRWQGSSRRH